MSADNQRAAHYYAERGWPVFALTSTKSPVVLCSDCGAGRSCPSPADMEACECLTCHSFYAATTDHDRIDDIFRRNPFGLVAIRTGRPSGLVVVDIDVKPETTIDGPPWTIVAALEELGLLPDTAMVITGSGGWHLLYAYPEYDVATRIRWMDGIDIKSDGGYIVAAPSIHPRTKVPYRWMTHPTTVAPLHPALGARMQRQPAITQTRQPFRPTTTRGSMVGILKYVAQATAGEDRNKRLYWGARTAGAMAMRGEITEADAITCLIEVGRALGMSESEMVGRGDAGSIGSGIRTARVNRGA